MGRKHTEESKKKMSEIAKKIKHKQTQGFQKGHGLLGNNSTSKGKSWKWTEEQKRNWSEKVKGENNPAFGKKHTPEHKAKIGEKFKGDKCHFWKGGITKININIRCSSIYAQWRTKCFERDNWTCQTCQKRSNVIVHHIKEFSKILKEYNIKTMEDAEKCNELWDINNGVTLCTECHKLTFNYKNKANK